MPPLRVDLSESGAHLSSCRRYRYRLWRSWNTSRPTCAFVGLNPSTADETKDDPTIRKCIAFALAWGFGRCEVVNLFALRSTDPAGLLRMGARSREVWATNANDRVIASVVATSPRLVLAWGSHTKIRSVVTPRERAVRRCIEAVAEVLRKTGRPIEIGDLGTNADGSPRHPLYLPYSTAFQRLPHATSR
jgi:hypothetical protein